MKKTIIGIGVVIVILVALSLARTGSDSIVYWKDTTIPCLPNGHQNVAQHIHPVLAIISDGAQETIDGDIGIAGTCMAEIHTHDSTGSIHIETADAATVYTLNDFYGVWGKDIAREGYTHTISVDGVVVPDGSFILKDHQEIVVTYEKENA